MIYIDKINHQSDIFLSLEIFHCDISGKDINKLQPLNIFLIFSKLLMFQFNISGKDIKE